MTVDMSKTAYLWQTLLFNGINVPTPVKEIDSLQTRNTSYTHINTYVAEVVELRIPNKDSEGYNT
jgi:hypothetical protein